MNLYFYSKYQMHLHPVKNTNNEIFTLASHSWKRQYQYFHYIDKDISGFHSKRENILYVHKLYLSMQAIWFSTCHHVLAQIFTRDEPASKQI